MSTLGPERQSPAERSRAGDQARALLELDSPILFFLLLNHQARKIRVLFLGSP